MVHPVYLLYVKIRQTIIISFSKLGWPLTCSFMFVGYGIIHFNILLAYNSINKIFNNSFRFFSFINKIKFIFCQKVHEDNFL